MEGPLDMELAGEVIEITRNGKVIVEMRPKRQSRMDDPEFVAARERLLAGMVEGIPSLNGPFSYEERTGR